MRSFLFCVFLVTTSLALAESRNPMSGLPGSLAALREYRPMRVSSESRPTNGDMLHIGANETTTIAQLDGPGEITHMWTTIATKDKDHLRNIVLRIYWDGNDFPSVEAPIGDFYGLGHGEYYYFNNPVQAIGTNKGMNCFWPMPFARSARLAVTNESTVPVRSFYYYVDWRKFSEPQPNLSYFHAQYHQAFPNKSGSPYLFLETSGVRGHFVGAHLSILTQVSGWWGEGDDIFTIDGEARPSLWGTGSEDYFSGAWGFGDPFYTDYFGMPFRERMTHDSNNRWNVYRLHLENPIAFEKSLKFEMEHGAMGFDETRAGGRNNDYASVAYYYLAEPRPVAGPLPPAAERISVYHDLTKKLDGVFEVNRMKVKASEGLVVEEQELSVFSAATGAKWFNDNHLWGRGKIGDEATLTFEVTSATAVAPVLHLTKGPDYGRIRVELDKKVLVRDFDGYSTKVVSETISRGGKRRISAGPHELVIKVIGKNPASQNTLWGVDYLRLGPQAPEGVETTKP